MLSQLIGPVAGLLDKFIPDKDAAAALSHEIATMAERHGQELALAQLAVNKEEAKGNWFQSSWRPATAWVCVMGMAINFMISPLLAPWEINVPQVDTATMMPVLMGLLGLGTLRTFERTKGVSK
ncbi:holin family protein [bacterium]|nr:holin family protein [bacterium]